MKRDHDPFRAPEPEQELPEFTPALAIWLTVSGSFLSFMFALSLASAMPQGSTAAAFGIGTLAGFGIAFMLARPFIGDPPGPSLGFTTPPARAWIAAMLFLPALLLISELENLLALIAPRPERPASEPEITSEPAFLAQVFIVSVVIAPLVTEIFFRGLIQPRLIPHWGSLGAVIGAAVLTTMASLPVAMASMQPSSLAIPLGQGLLQGSLRRTGGSIYPGLLLGAGYGLLHMLAGQQVFGIPGFDLVEGASHTPLSMLALPAMLLGVGLALCRPEADDPAQRAARDIAKSREP